MTALDLPSFGPVCHSTDAAGNFIVTLPQPSPDWAYINVQTNDLLPCFSPGHAFSVAEIANVGALAPNTCGVAATTPHAQAGALAAFAHQMTFTEVLKAMWKEL